MAAVDGREAVDGQRAIELSLPGARVAFSTRLGGVSEAPYESLNLGFLTGDRRSDVVENRRRLAREVGLEGHRIATGRQVHGAEIREWSEPPSGGDLPQVDAHATTVPELGLLVLVADCLPVALASPERVAMLHCGWRGLASGLVERGLAGFESPPAAAIGPGIGRCCYRVGREVLDAFRELLGVASSGMLDLRAIARRKLEAGGVERIEEVDHCTSCRGDLYFSHRRDGEATGRQGGLIWRSG